MAGSINEPWASMDSIWTWVHSIFHPRLMNSAPRALSRVLSPLLIHCRQKPACETLVKIQMCRERRNVQNKMQDTKGRGQQSRRCCEWEEGKHSRETHQTKQLMLFLCELELTSSLKQGGALQWAYNWKRAQLNFKVEGTFRQTLGAVNVERTVEESDTQGHQQSHKQRALK